jgi:glutathione S-transferase
MALTLYLHPLASFCHKVLVALYENGTAFEPRLVDLGDAASSADLRDHWPVGKIPVLRDRARDATVAETSIIIVFLLLFYAGPAALLPEAFEEALQVRLWDRFFDLYVNVPMGKIVTDRIRPEGRKDPHGVDEARATLALAYDMIERQTAGRSWAAGESFSMADCAAAPALFYAGIVQPFDKGHPALAAYFERLRQRPSFRRVLAEARPYFAMFPYRDEIPKRFL